MFIFVDGIMGSGKSYYGVHYIHKNASKYKTIYTNINGFKFNRYKSKTRLFKFTDKINFSYDLIVSYNNLKWINSIHWQVPVNVRPLNWDKLLEVISTCHDIFKKAESSINDDMDEIELDSLFIEYLLEIGFISINPDYAAYKQKISIRSRLPFYKRIPLNIFKSINHVPEYSRVLITMDEAYNYFNKTRADDLLLWFISYSRHMYIDAILFSQDASDVNVSYLKRMEYFLRAIPETRQLNKKKMTYKKHVKFPFYDGKGGTFVGNVSLPKEKKVFSFYKSGDKVDSPSVYTRYILYALLAFSVVGFGFYWFISTLSGGNIPKVEKAVEKVAVESAVTAVVSADGTVTRVLASKPSYENLTFLKFLCLVDTCTTNDKKIVLSVDDLNNTVSHTSSKYLSLKVMGDDIAVINILASEQFLNLFQRVKNEKKSIGLNFIN